MNIFDKIGNSAFKETEDGICIYYPKGIFGKGRIVPTPEIKENLFNFRKKTHGYGATIVAISFATIGKPAVFAFALILLPMYLLMQYKLIRNLVVHDSRISASELYAKLAIPTSIRVVIFVMGLLGLLVFLLGLLILKTTGYLLLVLSFTCICFSLYLRKLENKKGV